MDESCVPPETRSLARELAPIAAAHKLALGGGTACALRAPALKALTDGERFGAQPALDLRIEWSIEAAVAYFEAEARRLVS